MFYLYRITDGHFAKDCPQGGGGNNACRNCGQEGHFAQDCDQPRNMDNVVCRNCEQHGHFSRDCPQPRDCKFRNEILQRYLLLSALKCRRDQGAVQQLPGIWPHQGSPHSAYQGRWRLWKRSPCRRIGCQRSRLQ